MKQILTFICACWPLSQLHRFWISNCCTAKGSRCRWQPEHCKFHSICSSRFAPHLRENHSLKGEVCIRRFNLCSLCAKWAFHCQTLKIFLQYFYWYESAFHKNRSSLKLVISFEGLQWHDKCITLLYLRNPLIKSLDSIFCCAQCTVKVIHFECKCPWDWKLNEHAESFSPELQSVPLGFILSVFSLKCFFHYCTVVTS